MTWPAQVLHIVRKDVLLHRWPLLLCVLAFGAVTAARFRVDHVPAVGMTMFAAMVLSLLVCVLVVQDDSPARSDALYATRPLYPSAVLAAKLLLAATIAVVLPLATTIPAAVALDAGALFAAAAARGALGWFASLTLLLLLAAVTRGLRAFLVFAVGLMFAAQLIGTALLMLRGDDALPSTGPVVWVPLATLGMGLGVLALLYHTRNVRAAMWQMAALFALGLLAAGSGAALVYVSAAAAELTDGADVAVRGVTRHDGDGQARLMVELEVTGAAPNLRYRFRIDELHVTGADGSERRFPAQVGWQWLNDRAPPLPPGHRLLALPRDARAGPILLPLHGVDAAMLSDEVRVEVRGELTAVEPVLRYALPLRPGAAASGGGSRTTVTALGSGAGTPLVSVRTVQLLPGEAIPHADMATLEMPSLLVSNARLQQAFTLDMETRLRGTASLFPVDARLWRQDERTRADGADPAVPVDAAWLREAEIRRFDWVSRGARRVELKLPLPVLEPR